MQLQKRLREWLRTFLLRRIEKRLILRNIWKLDQLEYVKTTISYVLFENKAYIINNFLIPVRIESIHFDLLNQDIKVGEVLYENSTKLPMKSKKYVTMEMKHNHITAFFNALRLFLVREITVNVVGEIHLKILGMHFFVPVMDTVSIPKEKIRFIREKAKRYEKTVSKAEFEEIEPISDEQAAEQIEVVEEIKSEAPVQETIHEPIEIEETPVEEAPISPNSEETPIEEPNDSSVDEVIKPDVSDGHTA